MTDLVSINIKKLHPDAIIPTRGSEFAVGYDLYSCETVIIQPNEVTSIPTGISVEIPENYEFQVRSRSGLGSKGLIITNSPGTIDPDYRGEIKVMMTSVTEKSYTLEKGTRVAQLVLAPRFSIDFQEVEELNTTKRGDGGFGSTGV